MLKQAFQLLLSNKVIKGLHDNICAAAYCIAMWDANQGSYFWYTWAMEIIMYLSLFVVNTFEGRPALLPSCDIVLITQHKSHVLLYFMMMTRKQSWWYGTNLWERSQCTQSGSPTKTVRQDNWWTSTDRPKISGWNYIRKVFLPRDLSGLRWFWQMSGLQSSWLVCLLTLSRSDPTTLEELHTGAAELNSGRMRMKASRRWVWVSFLSHIDCTPAYT